MFDGGRLVILFKESLGQQPSIGMENLKTSIDFLWLKNLDKIIVALT